MGAKEVDRRVERLFTYLRVEVGQTARLIYNIIREIWQAVTSARRPDCSAAAIMPRVDGSLWECGTRRDAMRDDARLEDRGVNRDENLDDGDENASRWRRRAARAQLANLWLAHEGVEPDSADGKCIEISLPNRLSWLTNRAIISFETLHKPKPLEASACAAQFALKCS